MLSPLKSVVLTIYNSNDFNGYTSVPEVGFRTTIPTAYNTNTPFKK